MSPRTARDVFTDIYNKQEKLKKRFEADPVGVYKSLRPYFRPHWDKGYMHPSPEIVGTVFLDFAALFGIKSLKETNELLAKQFEVDPRQIKRWKEMGRGKARRAMSSIGEKRWHDFIKFVGILPINLDKPISIAASKMKESKKKGDYIQELKNSILKWPNPVFPPSKSADDPVEHAMGEALEKFTNLLDDWYDPEFSLELRNSQDTWFGAETLEKKRAILAWPDHKLRPNPNSEDPKEREIALNLRSYISPSSSAHDVKFAQYVKIERRGWFERTEEKKKAILAWNDLENPPNPKAPGIEGVLGRAYRNYTTKKGPSYDAKFDAIIREERPKWRRSAKKQPTTGSKKA